MTTPIPDEFRDLPGISDVEIKEMIEEGKVDIKNRVVLGIAIRALHRAIFQGIPVNVRSSFIDGRLDLTAGKPVPVEEVASINPERKRWLEDKGINSVVALKAAINIGKGTHIRGPVLANDVVFLGGIYFNRATFRNETSFERVTFCDRASFENARLHKGGNFSEANFRGGVSFERAVFGGGASFEGATLGDRAAFRGATFGDGADFGSTTFSDKADFRFATFGKGAVFWDATFGDGADFEQATFGAGAVFWDATFGDGADFVSATLGDEADFWSATFGDRTTFRGATFEGAAVFWGAREQPKDGKIKVEENMVFKGRVDFSSLKLRVPQKVRFQTVNLSQARFLHIPLEKVQFIDVDWNTEVRPGRRALYEEEVAREEERELVRQLYLQLKKNYEEQRDYLVAGDFHYGEMEMTLKQQEREWKEESKKWPKFKKQFAWFLTSSYKFLSGYGEKVDRAIVILLAILLAGVPFYCLGKLETNPQMESWAAFWDGLVSSMGYMTFRLSQPPTALWAKPMMAIQALLGPIQLALTALALRRKFRR